MQLTIKKMIILFRHITYTIPAVLILFLTELTGISQDTINVDANRSKLYSGISFGLSRNSLKTSTTAALEGLSSSSGNSFRILFEMGYFFSKHSGILTGIGYEDYSNEFSLNSYTDSFPSIDMDNEAYERRVSALETMEHQDISMINIPLSFIYRIPVSRRAGFFLSAGMNLSIPIVKNYTSSGTYTFTGYYSSYNVLFHDLPEYGFPSDTQSNSEGSLDLEPYIINAIAGAGFQVSLSKNLQVALGVNYKRSLTDISQSGTEETFQLSSDINQINSMLGGLTGSRIETIDLSFSLRYYFR
jgi:hypothetical protein